MNAAPKQGWRARPGEPAAANEPRYDYATNQWQPQCPYGDVCTGCDAKGRCTRVILTEDEWLDHLASLEDARSY